MRINLDIDTNNLSDDQCSALLCLISNIPVSNKETSDLSPETAFGTTHHKEIQNANVKQNELIKAASIGLVSGTVITGNALPDGSVITTVASADKIQGIGGVELDKDGLPWDARIHAESKNKVADGTWRKKRKLDATLLANVEAELRQVMGAPQVRDVYVQQPSPIQTINVTATVNETPLPLPPTSEDALAIPQFLQRTPVLATPTPPAPPAAPSGDPRQQYVQLIGRSSAAMGVKKVTQEELTAICNEFGIPSLPLLANRLDLLPTVASRIDTLIASR